MKFYYIDDSMFQHNDFAKEMQYRFDRLLFNNNPSMVLISASNDANEELLSFIKRWNKLTILISPALFDVDTIRGNLKTSFLSVEHFPTMQSYSGTCIEYDTKQNLCKRIYLDVFSSYHKEDEIQDEILKELEEIIKEKIGHIHKKEYH